jgi:hypothetical protein
VAPSDSHLRSQAASSAKSPIGLSSPLFVFNHSVNVT